jgi:hypothetical protein
MQALMSMIRETGDSAHGDNDFEKDSSMSGETFASIEGSGSDKSSNVIALQPPQRTGKKSATKAKSTHEHNTKEGAGHYNPKICCMFIIMIQKQRLIGHISSI